MGNPITMTAQGLLRKELIDTLGVRVAQGILSRFGYVHGRRMAEAMKTQFKWDSDEERVLLTLPAKAKA